MTRVLLLTLLTPVLAVFAPATLYLPSERVAPPAGEGDGKKQQMLEVAPPPREPWKFPLTGGTVTAIDGSSITIQGYNILVKGATQSKLGWEERRRTVTQTGNPLIITGSFPPMTGVRLFSDARGTIITHADETTTEIRMSEQPHRRYLVSDALKAGWYGEGAGGSYTYRLADVLVGDVVDMRILSGF